jgi:hypothetical protein
MQNEEKAKEKFEHITGLKVKKYGLFIDKNKPFLAAYPDGLINSNAILEIKCPYSAREITIDEAIKNKIIDYLTINDENYIKIKTSHPYYYQLQGQLHVTNRDIC